MNKSTPLEVYSFAISFYISGPNFSAIADYVWLSITVILMSGKDSLTACTNSKL